MTTTAKNRKTLTASLSNLKLNELKEKAKESKIDLGKATECAEIIEVITLHFFPEVSDGDHTERKAKKEALDASKKAKKEKKVNEASVQAMIAISKLVESGSENVTCKANKTGSVLWVKINKHADLNGLENAVISNIMKATSIFGKKATCHSFTLAASGYKCLHIRS